MKLKRLFRFGLVLASLFVVALIVCAAWLYTTESGARFVLARAIAAGGDALAIGTVEGSFRRELILSELRYRDERIELDIERLSLRLGIASLLERMLVIQDLASTTVRLRLLARDDANDGSPPGQVELPLTIRLDRASVSGLSIERGDSQFEVERITLSGVVEPTEALISRLELRAFDFFLSGQGGLSWSDGFGIEGIVSWSGTARDRQWLGSVDIAGTWPEFEIDEEMLEPFAQTARGRVIIDAVPAADLLIDWDGLGEIAVRGDFDPASRRARANIQAEEIVPAALLADWPGRLSVAGDLAASFDGDIQVASENLELVLLLDEERIDVDLAGAFAAPRMLSIDRLIATHGSNRIELTGTVDPELELDLELLASLGDLAALSALLQHEALVPLGVGRFVPNAFGGRAEADLAVTGAAAAPLIAGRAQVEQAHFGGLPLEFDIGFATPVSAVPEIAIEHFDLALGASRLAASGGIRGITLADDGADATVDLTVEATLDDLAELGRLIASDEVGRLLGREINLPSVAGRADTRFALTGPLRRLDLAGQLALADIDYGDIDAATGSLEGEFGLYAGGRANLRIDAAAAGYSVAARARGALGAGAWEGRVDSLDIGEPWLGAWTLVEPVELTLGMERVALPRACLVHAGSSICGEMRRGTGDDLIAVNAEDFELALLAPLLPDTVALTGRLQLDANLDALTTRPVGQLTARATDIGIEIRLSEAERFATTLESVALDASLADPALDLTAVVEGLAGGRAEVRLASADLRDRDSAISGRFFVDWPDLTALALLSPDIGEVRGALELEIEVAGTAADPLIAGNAGLADGSIVIPEWGVSIDRIDAEATSPDGESLQFSGRGYLEDRPVDLEGITVLDPARNWPTRLRVSGENLPVARRPDATVFASPELDVTIDLPSIAVSGRVLVPEADISVEQLSVQSVRVSPDAVVHGPRLEEAARPIDLTADLTIELGDRVRYSGGNLSTDLTGSLRLEYRSGFTPVASGNVNLSGSYDAYGQNLTLERGELLFAGPLNNPALDVLAVRRIGSTIAGLRLSGTLLAPNAELYSEPVMSDADALSYLMFGRPLSSSDDADAATLESTALALGLQQALPAFQRVGESLGLDELTIAPNDIDAGALMAGKYLSPKVYMSYTYGLFNRLGGFLLRYDINDRFSLETRSGNEKSMDLLYSIEKD